jgi:ATP-dependent Zn protease
MNLDNWNKIKFSRWPIDGRFNNRESSKNSVFKQNVLPNNRNSLSTNRKISPETTWFNNTCDFQYPLTSNERKNVNVSPQIQNIDQINIVSSNYVNNSNNNNNFSSVNEKSSRQNDKPNTKILDENSSSKISLKKSVEEDKKNKSPKPASICCKQIPCWILIVLLIIFALILVAVVLGLIFGLQNNYFEVALKTPSQSGGSLTFFISSQRRIQAS